MKFRALDRCEGDLNDDLAETHRTAKRTVLRLLTQMISDGQTAGVVQPVEPRIAALGIIGMCNWVAWWYVAGEDDAEPIVDQLVEMAMRSISTDGAAEAEATNTHQVIADIRLQLSRLEKML